MALELIFDQEDQVDIRGGPVDKGHTEDQQLRQRREGKADAQAGGGALRDGRQEGALRRLGGKGDKRSTSWPGSSTQEGMARYFTYKDWRDRGLVARYPDDKRVQGAKPQHTKRYNSSALKLKGYKLKGTFYTGDLVTVVDEDEKGKGAVPGALVRAVRHLQAAGARHAEQAGHLRDRIPDGQRRPGGGEHDQGSR